MSHSFLPPERILMGPGPSDVSPRVLAAMARHTIGHLDPAFVELMEDVKDLLRHAFLTENPVTFPLSSPASAAMELCLINLLEPGDKVIVAINGVFGGRMAEIARRCGAEVVTVESEWGRAVEFDKVAEKLEQHSDAKLLAVVHGETSTGAASDVASLAQLAHEHDCLILVDAVTSLGGIPLKVDEWELDAVYSGTQKCLSCAPGIAPLTLSERAVKAIKNRKTPVQSWFLDVNLMLNYWSGDGGRTYHHTAPVNGMYGLHESLLMLLEEGLEASWARHAQHHESLVAQLEQLGLSMFVPADERLPQLNTVTIPDGCDDAAVRRYLLIEYGLEIGAGLGPLAGKVWRIGLMGHSCDQEHVDLSVRALKEALREA